MKTISCFFALFVCVLASAQNDIPMRDAFVLKVKRNVKQTYFQQVNQSPYFVTDKILQIYPYEKVNVEIEIKADTIYSMKTVEKNLFPERTLEIEFCQSAENYTAKPTQLWVKNPFGKNLKYNVLAYSIEESEWKNAAKTAKARSSSSEMWKKEVVSSLVLKDWKLENNLDSSDN